jgi:hypothetical protein
MVVHHRHQVVPAPVYHLEMGTVGCSEFVRSLCLAMVFLASFEANCFSRLDQSLSFKYTKYGAL